jgi:hypothetical protein
MFVNFIICKTLTFKKFLRTIDVMRVVILEVERHYDPL